MGQPGRFIRRFWVRSIRIARSVGGWIGLPFRALLELRRSLTGASMTLLLFGICSLNIIWGYPWTGIFALCFTFFVLGAILNRVLRPRLEIEFVAPTSTAAGSTIGLEMYVRNRSRLPAMDMHIGFDIPARQHQHDGAVFGWQGGQIPTPMIAPMSYVRLPMSISSHLRGIHRLPDVSVVSSFPFQLFRSRFIEKTESEIAITPRPLSADDDAISGQLLESLGQWSHRMLAGNALDYTGSREYEVGMPVRRWDYVSWARLGKPIVREYQSPSVQSVMLLVNTASTRDENDSQGQDSTVERILSLAATAISELARKSVKVRMYVTSELPEEYCAWDAGSVRTDSESLLIRLAAAKVVSPVQAQDHLQDVLQRIGNRPSLLLTSQNPLPSGALQNVHVLHVETEDMKPKVLQRRKTAMQVASDLVTGKVRN